MRVAVFDGENADPANGRRMQEGHLAYTPWGEIASALGGKNGYERVRKSDENQVAPGSATLCELFGGNPTLILLDELSVYLRKIHDRKTGREQLTAFLTSLFSAVESTPNAALVYTLAIGKDRQATDAYTDENQFIADKMAEAESVSARKATLLNPTEEDETVQVLRRRLFEFINENVIDSVVDAYWEQWNTQRKELPESITRPKTREVFRLSYPLHPEVLETLTAKMSTLSNFQRVRGMLRLLACTVSHLWTEKPSDATAIHIHHIDPSYEPIRREIVTRLMQQTYLPAISNDISAGPAEKMSLAQEIDVKHHKGLPPYASYVARTIFVNTLAFNDQLKGILPDQLRYSVLGPAINISLVDEARKKFLAESAYLDDRPGAPMRFLAEANLRQIIRREEGYVDAEHARAELNDRIREIFNGKTLCTVSFPGGPFDVADDIADGRPKLVVLGYDAVTIGSSVDTVPELIKRIYERKGSDESAFRVLRNNIIFVAADKERRDEMIRKTYFHLALVEMKRPERLVELAEHQQNQVREIEARSEYELAITIQQCYRHIFYPSRDYIDTSKVNLAHSAIDIYSTSDKPGAGQHQIVRALRDLKKLRLSEDEPDSPDYIRDRTPLKKGKISTLSLRDEFRQDPTLPILIDDDIFIRGVELGIEQGKYLYKRENLLVGPNDPRVKIKIDEQSVIFTISHAKETGLWPRKPVKAPGNRLDDTKKNRTSDPVSGKINQLSRRRVSSGIAPNRFAAEGTLQEALTLLWEQVHAKKVEAVAVLTIRIFEATDAFRLLNPVGSISGAEKTVKITGGYETHSGGSFHIEFQGSVSDAQPVQEFLRPQLRDASERHLNVEFELTFENGQFPMNDNAMKKITERLCSFATDAPAHVSVIAEVNA